MTANSDDINRLERQFSSKKVTDGSSRRHLDERAGKNNAFNFSVFRFVEFEGKSFITIGQVNNTRILKAVSSQTILHHNVRVFGIDSDRAAFASGKIKKLSKDSFSCV